MSERKPYTVVVTKTITPSKSVFIVYAADDEEACEAARSMAERGAVQFTNGETRYAVTTLVEVEV